MDRFAATVIQLPVLQGVLASRARPVPPPDLIDRLGQPLAERPETIEEQRVHGKTSEGGLNLNAVELAVSLRVYLNHCQNASSLRHRCPSPRTKYLLAPGAAPILKTLGSRCTVEQLWSSQE